MNTKKDTFNRLRRTPFNIVLEEYDKERHRDVYSIQKLKSICKKHHWDFYEFDIKRSDYYDPPSSLQRC